jgi:glycosyltransferase involved in cell wall biosynthesis
VRCDSHSLDEGFLTLNGKACGRALLLLAIFGSLVYLFLSTDLHTFRLSLVNIDPEKGGIAVAALFASFALSCWRLKLLARDLGYKLSNVDAAAASSLGQLRAIRPALVHNIALKPVIYGTIAASLAGVPAVVNSITGFGFLFASNKIIASLSGRVILVAVRRFARMQRVLTICQNDDDAALIFPAGTSKQNLRIIRGSGVDIAKFSPSPEPDGPPVAAFVGRMLSEKGLQELVAAAGLLAQRRAGVRIVLFGPIDDQNPGAISEQTIAEWQRDGLVEWRGNQDDVVEVWRHSHIAVLPSYREGLPKALLEAAACGRPIVATDVPGCRDVVEHERTGLLVPVRDPEAIADALQKLASSAKLRVAMGQAGRDKVAADFSDEMVTAQMSTAYRDARRAGNLGRDLLTVGSGLNPTRISRISGYEVGARKEEGSSLTNRTLI